MVRDPEPLANKPNWWLKSSFSPQLRRQTRERREYIFKKSQESQERSIYERKQRIKDLLAAGKPLPTELRNEARREGGKDLVLDEAQTGASSSVDFEIYDIVDEMDVVFGVAPKNHVDDEYAKVGTYDPKVVITTSRSPSSRLLQFSKVHIYLSSNASLRQCSIRLPGAPPGLSKLIPPEPR